MKKKNLMLLFISALLMGFTFASCGSDDDPVIEKPGTEEPGGDDPDPEAEAERQASLSGSNYYVIAMDQASYEKIESKVVADFRPNGAADGTAADGKNKNLYVWNGYEPGAESVGPNYYLEQGWTSFQANGEWNGAGYFVPWAFQEEGGEMAYITETKNAVEKLKNIDGYYEDYYLHIAIKDLKTRDVFHNITLWYVGKADGSDNKGTVVLGNIPNDDGQSPYKDFRRDGEWQAFDIPLTLFQEQGLQFRYEGELSLTPSKPDDNNVGVNILSHSSKTTLGVSFDYDAVFIYKKAK